MEDFLRRTWAEIDLDALTYNYKQIKSISNGKEIIAVVKANAYGHGDRVVSRHLMELGVLFFAVSNVWEAESLIKGGVSGNILIFGYTDFEHIKSDIDFNLIYIVGNVEYAKQLNSVGKSLGKKIRVHIKIDTGMSRIGIDTKAEFDEVLSLNWLSCEGAFTHFAVADSENEDDIRFTEIQQEKFIKIAGDSGLLLHSQNSGGIALHSDFTGDLVRTGISLYGQKPAPDIEVSIDLKPVLTLKSIISQIKEIDQGATVSYGRRFKADGKKRIAVIPAGYADGYSRRNSNRGIVLINGQKAPIVGTVCMDLMMVDITHLDANVGDEVILYSNICSETSIDFNANIANTISYELLCAIAMRVPRVYIKGGKIVDIVKYI